MVAGGVLAVEPCRHLEWLATVSSVAQAPQTAFDGTLAALLPLLVRLRQDAGEDTAAHALDKIALAPRAARHADIQLHTPRALPAAHELLERPLDLPQRASDVVGGP